MRIFKVAVKRKQNLHLMAISALNFKKSSNDSILKQCFDAIRQSKEDDKLDRMHAYLHDDTRPVIDLLTFQVHGM